MKRLILLLGLLPCAAFGQGAQVLSACGGATYGAGPVQNPTQDTTGRGCMAAFPASATPVAASSALASNIVLKASAGTLYGFQVNTTSAAEFVMLFNATSLPANGAVTPVLVWQVPLNTTKDVALSPGLVLGTGITVGCSTTGPFTLTASTLCSFGGGVVQ